MSRCFWGRSGWAVLPGLVVSLLATVSGRAAVTFRSSPGVIRECTAGSMGKFRLSWDTGGVEPVQVRVGSAAGTPMTGWEPAIGLAPTGDWVTDGLVFVLVNAEGAELARLTAIVRCDRTVTADSPCRENCYLPLRVGNQWTYRVDNRNATATYRTVTVSRTEAINGQTYFDYGGRCLRSDEQGRIYELNGAGEFLFLDPTAMPDPSARLRVRSRGVPVVTAAGIFENVIEFEEPPGGLAQNQSTFALGVGLVRSSTSLIAGSSGGFAEGLELVHARLDDGRVISAPEVSVALALERSEVRVVEGEVTNCALPCYFVACFGADPPGTFKPCLRARITLNNHTAEPLAWTSPTAEPFDILLADEAGNVVFRYSEGRMPKPGPVDREFAPGETNFWVQLPLYSEPNVPLATGRYRVTGLMEGGDGRSYTLVAPLTLR